MMRLIDADSLTPCFVKFASDGCIYKIVFASDVEHAHTIDAVPVRHGEWATDEEDIRWGNSLKRKYCTNCGKRPHFDKEKWRFVLTDYCPNCGAKMDGGAENG